MQPNSRRHARAIAIATTRNDRLRMIALRSLATTMIAAGLYVILVLPF
jgi:hypothetical protein